MKFRALVFMLIFLVSAAPAFAQTPLLYDIGTPTLTNVYVDPINGQDSNTGDTPETALQTVSEAWQRIPIGEPLTSGVHIHLAAGIYTAAMMPNYWESRYGTYDAPVIIQGTGADTRLATINLFDSHFIYFMDFVIDEGSDAFHCEQCDHVLLRGLTLRGADPDTYQAQEVLKVNQSTNFYVENSDISGAWNNAVDFVAVQYGHVVANQIHDAGDWCMYTKGGSAYLTIEANEFYDCITGGYSAGEGTGFQYMVPPFIRYEAYYIRFVNNLVHDVQGAAVGVQGGYNILFAYNTFQQIGARSHMLDILFGGRSCDGQPGDEGRERCDEYAALGGWGNSLVGDGDNFVRIPNRHIYIYNNIFFNSGGYRSEYQHFTVFAPYSGEFQAESGAPNPALSDDDLRIVGNVIWNGSPDHPLGVGSDSGCLPENPTCNPDQLARDNAINTLQPNESGQVSTYAPVALPPFVVDDTTVPMPDSLENPLMFAQVGRN